MLPEDGDDQNQDRYKDKGGGNNDNDNNNRKDSNWNLGIQTGEDDRFSNIFSASILQLNLQTTSRF